MPFVEYPSRGRRAAVANYIRAATFSLKLSEDLWQAMGSPQWIKLYYDEEKNSIGMRGAEDGLGFSVVKRTDGVIEIPWKKMLEFFTIILEKPQSCKVVKEGGLFVFPLSNGRR